MILTSSSSNFPSKPFAVTSVLYTPLQNVSSSSSPFEFADELWALLLWNSVYSWGVEVISLDVRRDYMVQNVGTVRSVSFPRLAVNTPPHSRILYFQDPSLCRWTSLLLLDVWIG